MSTQIGKYDVVQIDEEGHGAESIGYSPADAGRFAIQYDGQMERWAEDLDTATEIIGMELGRAVRLRRAEAYGNEARWVPEWAEAD